MASAGQSGTIPAAVDAPALTTHVDVALVGASSITDPAFLPALHRLQTEGRLRVRVLVESADVSPALLRHSFPDAAIVTSLTTAALDRDALVILASPPHLHPAQVTSAFKRGWHVLSLSPLASSAADGIAMKASAQRQNCILAAAQPKRFFPSLRLIRTLCHDQLLGPLVRFEIHDGIPPPASSAAPAPEGVLTEIGLPVFDMLLWFLGRGKVESYADDALGGVEANAAIELSFSDNVAGRVHLSRDWPTSQSYEFVFERAIVRWFASRPDHVHLQLASAPAGFDAIVTAPFTAGQPIQTAAFSAMDGFVAQISTILDVIANPRRSTISATPALDALDLADECRKRRSPIEQPWLSRNEAVHARTLSLRLES